MKTSYLILIVLLAFECSLIAQKVEPSRTYNLIEKCYCTSFNQVKELYNGTIVYACTKCGKEALANPNSEGGTIEDIIEQNKEEAKLAELMKNPSQASNAEAAKMLGTIVPSTITKQQEEAMGDLINQSVKNQEEIIKAYEEMHYCLSFNFVRELVVITKSLIYECKECGKQVVIFPPDTIEKKIADNKRKMELEKAGINAIKKSQNVSNQQKPATASKPQKKSTPNATSYNKPGSPNYDPKKKWSGSLSDVLDVEANERKKFKIATNTHEGQNIGLAIPYTPKDMMREIIDNRNPEGYYLVLGDEFHQPDNINSFSKLEGRTSKTIIATGVRGSLGLVGGALVGGALCSPFPPAAPICAGFGGVWGAIDIGAEALSASTRITDPLQISQYLDEYEKKGIKYAKFQNDKGKEVNYDLGEGTIDLKQTLGTHNNYPAAEHAVSHVVADVFSYNINQKKLGKKVKYAGITYSYNDDGSVSIIDAQTGKPMTGAEVERFATSRADTTPTGTVNLPPEVFSVEQSTTPYSNYGQQRQKNNSALSTSKNSVFGK